MTDQDNSAYGWVVVAVCFVVYGLNYGMTRVSGLFYTDIISYYNVDRERASIPFLLGNIARPIGGPLCGYLSHKFGFRFAIILGCFVSSLGIFACSFATDINALCAFWTIYGFGCGMSTTILPQVINLFIKRHATKANGLALCGASAAGIILPFLTVALLNNYGMSGAYLNLSAVMLNCIPGVMLFRNTPSGRIVNGSSREKDNFKKDSSSGYETTEEKDEIASVSSKINMKTFSSEFNNSAYSLHKTEKDTLVKDQACFEELLIETDGDKVKKQINDIEFENNASQKLNINTFHNDVKDISETPGDLVLAKNSFGSLEKFSSSYDDRKDKVNSVDDVKSMTTQEESLIKNNKTASSKTNDKYSGQSQEHCHIKKNQSSLKIFRIYWDPLFFAFALPRCLSLMVYIIVPTVLVDFCMDKGISKIQSTYVLMAYSFADLFGKVCLGWVIDGKHMSRVRYIIFWYCILALSSGLMAWSNGFAVMTISVIFQGMGAATIGPTLFGLVPEYFEKEKQCMVMASKEIFLIPLCLGTGPLIGYFRDDLESYDGLAYTMSAVFILSAVLILLIPTISSWKMKRNDNNLNVNKCV